MILRSSSILPPGSTTRWALGQGDQVINLLNLSRIQCLLAMQRCNTCQLCHLSSCFSYSYVQFHPWCILDASSIVYSKLLLVRYVRGSIVMLNNWEPEISRYIRTNMDQTILYATSFLPPLPCSCRILICEFSCFGSFEFRESLMVPGSHASYVMITRGLGIRQCLKHWCVCIKPKLISVVSMTFM